MRKAYVLYGAALLAGVLVWMLVSALSGRREAWDSDLYFSFGIPALCLVAGMFGFYEPDRPWRWGLIPMAGQALCMFGMQGIGNLFPLGLIAFGIFALPLILMAQLGAGLSRRFAHG